MSRRPRDIAAGRHLGGPATHAPTPLIRAGSVIGRPGLLPQD